MLEVLVQRIEQSGHGRPPPSSPCSRITGRARTASETGRRVANSGDGVAFHPEMVQAKMLRYEVDTCRPRDDSPSGIEDIRRVDGRRNVLLMTLPRLISRHAAPGARPPLR